MALKRAHQSIVETTDILSSLDNLAVWIEQSGLKKRFPVVEKISGLIPIVAVVGDQSSGKSSFLSAVSGFRLISGEQTTTIARLEIRMRKSDLVKKTYTFLNHDGTVNQEKMPVGDNLAEDHHEFLKRISDGKFSDARLIVEISGPECNNITFVDLPGLIADNGLNTDQVKHVETMITEYVQKPNCLIVHIMSGIDDIDTMLSNRIVNLYDQNRQRTVTVVTKIDAVDTNKARRVTTFTSYDPKSIFVQCMNPTTGEIITSVDERRNLVDLLPGATATGRGLVLEEVEKFTTRIINQNKNELSSLLRQAKTCIRDELNKLGPSDSTGGYQLHRTWCRNLPVLVDYVSSDRDRNINLHNLKAMFEVVIPSAIPIDLSCVKDLMAEHQGAKLIGTVGCSPVVRHVVKMGIEAITEQVNNWFDKVEQVFSLAVKYLLDSENTPESCREIGKETMGIVLTKFGDELQTMKDAFNLQLEKMHTEPDLYDERDFSEQIVKARCGNLQMFQNLFRQIADEPHNAQQLAIIGYNKITELSTALSLQTEEINGAKVIIKTFWNNRIQTLRSTLFHTMKSNFMKLVKSVIYEIENLPRNKIEQLRELPKQAQHRNRLEQGDKLINESLQLII